MNSPSIRDRIEEFGAGIFIRNRNTESRLQAEDFHRAYMEPVTLWIMPDRYSEECMPELIRAAQNLKDVRIVRFPNVAVSSHILRLVGEAFPVARVEGIKKE